MSLKDSIERELFLNGQFSRQRASSTQNKKFIKELEAAFGKHRTVAETVYLAYGGVTKTCSCGVKTAFISFTKGYRTFCCSACMSKDSGVKQRRNVSIKQTCEVRYGTGNVLAIQSVRAKAQKTMMSRYGVDNFSKHGLHRDMVQATSKAKFGVDHPFQSGIVREKIKETMQARYGGFTASSPELAARMRKTMQQKYGAENSMHSVVKDKIQESKREHFLSRLSEQGFEVLNAERAEVRHTCGFTFNVELFTRVRCQNCKETSKPESELFHFINALGVQVIRNDRKILDGRELDILCPEYKLAIEMNGAFWHHDETDKLPLIEKTKLAREKGYDLIHLWDFEWYKKQEIVKSILLAKVGRAIKVHARKCTLREISKCEADDFLMEHHLQGTCRASRRRALFFGNTLVGVATFGKSRFDKNKTEVLRVCFRQGLVVQGGTSKLLNEIPNLVTYADLRFGTGVSYLKSGFTHISNTSPGYCWFFRGEVLHRYLTQRSKLSTLLGSKFNAELTEDQNMRLAGYLKLVDCGHAKFMR